MMRHAGLAAWLLIFATGAAQAGEYQGAQKALAVLIGQQATPMPTPAETAAGLPAAITDSQNARAPLAPDEAAARWLQLYDRLPPLRAAPFGFGSVRKPVDAWLAELPPPDAWPILAERLEDREPPASAEQAMRHWGLRLLVDTLNRDSDAIQRDTAALQKLAEGRPGAVAQIISGALSPPQAPADFRLTLDARGLPPDDAVAEQELKVLQQRLHSNRTLIYVPDLVRLVGSEEAEQLLVQVFLRPPKGLADARVVFQGEGTQALGRQVALARMAELKFPPWVLAQSLDAAALYEALVARFGVPDDSVGRHAAICYIVGLVRSGRLEDAEDALRAIQPSSGSQYLLELQFKLPEGIQKDRELCETLWPVLNKLAVEGRAPVVFGMYKQLTTQLGYQDRLLELAQRPLAPDEPRFARLQLNLCAAEVALAEGAGEPVAVILRNLPQAPAEEPTKSLLGKQAELGVKLARLGRLCGNQAWFDCGLETACHAHAQGRLGDGLISGGLIDLLLNVDAGNKAEQMVAGQIGRLLRASPQKNSLQEHRFLALRNSLTQLATIYARANRHEDVLILVEQAPWWNAEDLADIASHSSIGPDPLGLLVARALVALNRGAEARRILEALLYTRNGNDDIYELLAQIDGDAALRTFETQLKQNPYEERPLIWTAKILLARGELAAAEQAIRAALAIDPTDDGQGATSRMGYLVLADVLVAQGKPHEAKSQRRGAQAVSLAAEAQRYDAAGLKQRAQQTYTEALAICEDVHDIHARLARSLLETGDIERARRHFERSFELMPCTRSQSIFENLFAQPIAEEVFLRRLQSAPEHAPTHYLLGQLRLDQNRAVEAQAHLLEAVRLAPDFFVGWRAILDAKSRLELSPAQLDQATLTCLRLDPLQQNIWLDTSEVTDLAALWQAIERSAALVPLPPENLLPLKAAKLRLDPQRYRPARDPYDSLRRRLDPTKAVLDSTAIKKLRLLLGATR